MKSSRFQRNGRCRSPRCKRARPDTHMGSLSSLCCYCYDFYHPGESSSFDWRGDFLKKKKKKFKQWFSVSYIWIGNFFFPFKKMNNGFLLLDCMELDWYLQGISLFLFNFDSYCYTTDMHGEESLILHFLFIKLRYNNLNFHFDSLFSFYTRLKHWSHCILNFLKHDKFL